MHAVSPATASHKIGVISWCKPGGTEYSPAEEKHSSSNAKKKWNFYQKIEKKTNTPAMFVYDEKRIFFSSKNIISPTAYSRYLQKKWNRFNDNLLRDILNEYKKKFKALNEEKKLNCQQENLQLKNVRNLFYLEMVYFEYE